MAKDVDQDNSAAVHYDEGLADVGPVGSYDTSMASWREVN
jgi:hypothetical protein